MRGKKGTNLTNQWSGVSSGIELVLAPTGWAMLALGATTNLV